MVGPAIGLAYCAPPPLAELHVCASCSGGLQEAQGEMRVCGGQETGDAGGAVEPVCEGGGGENCPGGTGREEGGRDEGVGVEVAGCEGVRY